MNEENIINFLDFLSQKEEKGKKNSIKENVLETEVKPEITPIAEPKPAVAEVVEEIIPEVKEEPVIPVEETTVIETSNYKVYKDKDENFNCELTIEGASTDNTHVRLILESDVINLIYFGTIDSQGKCNIPIKRLNVLNEGVTGKIKLEVIADGTLFIPYESTFEVKLSKKVQMKMNENKAETKKTGISVSLK